jgi:hypothetical protein
MPINRTAIAGTDPRNKSEDDEKGPIGQNENCVRRETGKE